jgi:hypothetical protein
MSFSPFIRSVCPCHLSKEEVLDLDRRNRVAIKNGCCQNWRASFDSKVCGMSVEIHSLSIEWDEKIMPQVVIPGSPHQPTLIHRTTGYCFST